MVRSDSSLVTKMLLSRSTSHFLGVQRFSNGVFSNCHLILLPTAGCKTILTAAIACAYSTTMRSCISARFNELLKCNGGKILICVQHAMCLLRRYLGK